MSLIDGCFLEEGVCFFGLKTKKVRNNFGHTGKNIKGYIESLKRHRDLIKKMWSDIL